MRARQTKRVLVNGFGAFAGGIVRVHDEIVDHVAVGDGVQVFIANRPTTSAARPGPVVLSEQSGRRARDLVRDARAAFPPQRYDVRVDTAPAFRFLTLSRKFIVIVHDLNFLDAKIHGISWKQRAYRQVLHRWTLRRADRIVVVSDSTLAEVAAFLPRAKAKCVVLPLPVDHLEPFIPPAPVPSVVEPGEPIVAFTFGHASNKGVEHLLTAMAQEPALTLRVVCTHDQWAAHWATRAEALGVTDRCTVVERPSDEALAHEYLRADVICMLSSYEGYGLPAAEALYLGRPVVTTDLDVLRATTRGRAVYVDPARPGLVVEAIREALSRGDAHWQEAASLFRPVTWATWVRDMMKGL